MSTGPRSALLTTLPLEPQPADTERPPAPARNPPGKALGGTSDPVHAGAVSTCCAPGPVLGAQDTTLNQPD